MAHLLTTLRHCYRFCVFYKELECEPWKYDEYLEALSILLNNGASVDLAGRSGVTPLHLASENKCIPIELASDFINKSSDINKRNEDGKTALHCAIQSRRSIDFLKLLLKKGASFGILDINDASPLHLLADQEVDDFNRSEMINLITSQKGKFDPNSQDKEGRTILLRALKNDNIDLAACFLSSTECDPNICDSDGANALHYLARVTGDVTDVKKTLLHELLKKVENCNKTTTEEVLTPLHYAVRMERNPFSCLFVKELIKTDKCDSLLKNKYENTPLQYMLHHTPAEKRDTDITEILRALEPKQHNLDIQGSLIQCTDTLLGRGRFGVVYEGWLGERKVAVKKIWKEFAEPIDSKILPKIDDHPNIVTHYCNELHGEIYLIALELCDCTLQEHMTNIKSMIERKELMKQMLCGLNHLHSKGFVHGDLKPDNVFIRNNCVKISDFGQSMKLPQTRQISTITGGYAGTEIWSAPEVLQPDSKCMNSLSDIFSASLIMYVFSTDGVHPFSDGRNLINDSRKINVERIVDNIIAGNLVWEEQKRDDLLEDLVVKMTERNAETCITAESAQTHPFFWSSEKCLDFIHEVSKKINAPVSKKKSSVKNAEADKTREAATRNEELQDCISFTINALEENVDAEMKNGNWINKLKDCPQVQGYCTPGDDKSVGYLLKKVRNIIEHYKDLKPKLRQALGKYPEGVYQFFSSRYPTLLIDIFNTVQPYLLPYLESTDALKKFYSTD